MVQGQRSMPILQVKDVDASTDFFANNLGFHLAGKWKNDDDSTNFAIVKMDTITIGLTKNANAMGSGENWVSYLYLADVDAFADDIQGRGTALARGIVDQFYGCRDLEVVDLDGNRLCFGQDLSPTEDGPGL